jgi:drug/metabolite transporter (DMT)-like permease
MIMASKNKSWLFFAIITVILWGVWGAFMEIPAKNGFPPTLGYIVWAITTIPCAIFAIGIDKWKLDKSFKAIYYGMLIGLFGAGGQVLLFIALNHGPAYLVFPIISLSPVVTVAMASIFLKEKAVLLNRLGILLAIICIPFLVYQPSTNNAASGLGWLFLSLAIFVMWGIQAYLMKTANNIMHAESIFFYMMISAWVFVPVEWFLTDFSSPINWGMNGFYISFAIQILNSIGALCLVYAFRYGKAILVSPLSNAGGPAVTIIISLIIYGIVPHIFVASGMVIAITAAILLAI